MSTTVQAKGGVMLPLSSLDQTFTRDGSGNVTKISVAFNFVTYEQNITYDGSGNVTFISRWLVAP